MRRVVITGLGIVSCLGNDKETVSANLRAGRPGIRFNPEYAEKGLRSHVSGSVDLNLEELIDRKLFRFMGDAAAYAYLAMDQAIKDSGLSEEQVSNPRTGLIAGSGGASTLNQMEAIPSSFLKHPHTELRALCGIRCPVACISTSGLHPRWPASARAHAHIASIG